VAQDNVETVLLLGMADVAQEKKQEQEAVQRLVEGSDSF